MRTLQIEEKLKEIFSMPTLNPLAVEEGKALLKEYKKLTNHVEDKSHPIAYADRPKLKVLNIFNPIVIGVR